MDGGNRTDTVVARSISRRQKISLKFRARETNQTLLDIKRVGDIRYSSVIPCSYPPILRVTYPVPHHSFY